MRKSFLKKSRLVSLFIVLAIVDCAYGMDGEVLPTATSDEGLSQQNGEHPLANGNVHHEQPQEQQPRQLTWDEWIERLGEALRAAVDAIPDK